MVRATYLTLRCRVRLIFTKSCNVACKFKKNMLDFDVCHWRFLYSLIEEGAINEFQGKENLRCGETTKRPSN